MSGLDCGAEITKRRRKSLSWTFPRQMIQMGNKSFLSCCQVELLCFSHRLTVVQHSGRIGSNIGQKVSHYDRKLEWRGNIVISSSVAKITYIHTWWVKVAYMSQRKCFFFFCCRPDNRCKCWLGVVHAERVSTINSHFGRALIPFFNLK